MSTVTPPLDLSGDPSPEPSPNLEAVKPRSERYWYRLAMGAAYALALPITLLVAWALWATQGSSPFFPPPQRILDAFIDTWVGPAFVSDVLPSLARLGLGLVGSIAIGIAAGTLIGTVRWLRDLLEPLLEFFRAIPPPAMIPIIALIFGPTDTSKVVIIVLGAVWPVLLNTIDGVRATDSVMKDTARSFQLPRAERLRYLVLPSAMPRIMTGVRQSMSIGLILMVISEMFYASSGLGFQIVYFQRNYLVAEMWSGILLLGLVGILMAFIFSFAERRILRWYHGIKEVEHA